MMSILIISSCLIVAFSRSGLGHNIVFAIMHAFERGLTFIQSLFAIKTHRYGLLGLLRMLFASVA